MIRPAAGAQVVSAAAVRRHRITAMRDEARNTVSLSRTPVRRALARASGRILLLLFAAGLAVGLLWKRL